MSNSHLRYRPEIDGVRAIAVLSVVFFHAKLGFPGGFVGVDVFFVISGYLITALILRDVEASRFSIIEFWERRARRIIPALAAMTLLVLAVGAVVLLPIDLQQLGRSAIAQTLFVANFYFWRINGDYFDNLGEEKPLLHTWSLAVEEQFYLFFPLLLLFVFWLPKFRTRRQLILIFGSIFVVSLALSQYGIHKDPSATFYLLPTRAWELLTGSLLAFLPFHWNPRRKIFREVLSYGGLILIFYSVFGYSAGTVFPGFTALPPCIGTLLIIWSNSQIATSNSETVPLTTLGRLLALKPLVFIGLISYSLYLWHWPILAFAKYWQMEDLPLHLKWLAVALSFVLATLSWHFIETPFRVRRICSSRLAIFSLSALCLASISAIGMLYSPRGLPNRFANMGPLLDNVKDKNAPQINAAQIELNETLIVGDQSEGLPVEFLIWGDSHARRSLSAFEKFGRNNHLSGRAVIKNSTAPLLEYATASRGAREETLQWSEATFDYIERNHIRNVVLAARWERETKKTSQKDLKKALLHTVERLNEIGVTAYVLIQAPSHDFSVPRLEARRQLAGYSVEAYLRTPEKHFEAHRSFYELAAENKNPKLIFLDPSKYFLNSNKTTFIATKDGVPLYSDDHHLSYDASAELLGKMLDEQFHPQRGPEP